MKQLPVSNKFIWYDEKSPIMIYRTLYRWFRYRLSVNYPDEPITQYTYFFDSQGSAKAEEMLTRLDTGISKVQVYDESAEKIMAQFPRLRLHEPSDIMSLSQ